MLHIGSTASFRFRSTLAYDFGLLLFRPLIAALNGRLSICKLLLHEGADVSICDTDGCNAFDLATRYGHHAIASHLLATLAQSLSEGNEAIVTVYPAEAFSEGWEAEEEFHAPADSRVADVDVIALQVAIALHRVTRERDDWGTGFCLIFASFDKAMMSRKSSLLN